MIAEIVFLMWFSWMEAVLGNALMDILLKMANASLKCASQDIMYQEIAAKNAQNILILNNAIMLVQKEQNWKENNANLSVQEVTKFTAMENVFVLKDGIELKEFAVNVQRDKNMTMDYAIAFLYVPIIQYFKKHPQHANVLKGIFSFMGTVRNVNRDKCSLQTGAFVIFPAELMNNLMETNVCVVLVII